MRRNIITKNTMAIKNTMDTLKIMDMEDTLKTIMGMAIREQMCAKIVRREFATVDSIQKMQEEKQPQKNSNFIENSSTFS